MVVTQINRAPRLQAIYAWLHNPTKRDIVDEVSLGGTLFIQFAFLRMAALPPGGYATIPPNAISLNSVHLPQVNPSNHQNTQAELIPINPACGLTKGGNND
jgi:hypothetical protein